MFPSESPGTAKRNASSPLHSILKMKKKAASQQVLNTPGSRPVPLPELAKMTQFERRQKKGYIDVWWLYDDGGKEQGACTLLLGKSVMRAGAERCG